MSMQQVREQAVTDEVIASFAGAPSERLREVMSSLVRHLHDFAREVRLTEAEWQRGIDFLTRVGHHHDGQAAGVHSAVRRARPLHADRRGQRPATAGATESTVFGPFFVEDAPEVPLGGDIARGARAAVLCLRDRPLRRWHAAAGSADRGLGSRRGRLLRRPVRRRSQRRPGLAARRSQRRIPLLVRATRALSDSLRRTGRRSAASRRPQPDAARAPALQGRRPGHRTLITHIFVAGDKYLASDAVFGVKNSLIVDATEHPAGTAPDGSPIDRPYHQINFDIVLAPQEDPVMTNPSDAAAGAPLDTAPAVPPEIWKPMC